MDNNWTYYNGILWTGKYSNNIFNTSSNILFPGMAKNSEFKLDIATMDATKQAFRSEVEEFSSRPDFYSFTKLETRDSFQVHLEFFCPQYTLRRKIDTSVLRIFTKWFGQIARWKKQFYWRPYV